MRETGFINQNQEKWKSFEKTLGEAQKDPDVLSKQFIQITDDLSYSRTYYPNRSVRLYLNNLAQGVFNRIYRNRARKWERFVRFWKEELPRLSWESRKELLISLVIFLLSFLVGVVSSHYNPEFPAQILGEHYIAMTKENIESGDPMAVYKKSSEVDMFLGITVNNLRVAVLTFILGFFFSIGTIGIMIYNGIMVGCFQYFFYSHGLLKEASLTIWLHGTLEISSIVIAGAAGLVLGRGITFPGTYTRPQALRLSAQRGVNLLLGTFPIFVFASLIESFITRYTGVPGIIKGLLILVSAVFMVGYFGVLPWLKARRGFPESDFEARLPGSPEEGIKVDKLKDSGEIFRDTFVLFRSILQKFIGPSLFMSLFAGVYFTAFYLEDAIVSFTLHPWFPFGWIENTFRFMGDLTSYFNYQNYYWMLPVNFVFFSFASALFGSHYLKKTGSGIQVSMRKLYLRTLGPGLFFSGLYFLPPAFVWWMLALFMPVFLMWQIILFQESPNPFKALGRAFGFCFGSFWRVYGIYFIFLIVAFIGLLLVATPVVIWFLYEIIYWFLNIREEIYPYYFLGFFTTVSYMTLFLLLPLFYGAFGIMYYTLVEIRTAGNLLDRVRKIFPGNAAVWTLVLSGFLVFYTSPSYGQNEDVKEYEATSIPPPDTVAIENVEYYEMDYDSSYYYEQQSKRENHRKYFKSEISPKKFDESAVKKATKDLSYEEEEIKRKQREKNWFNFKKKDGIFSAATARIILFVLAAGVIVFVLYLIVKRNLSSRNKELKKKVYSLEEAEENLHEADLEALLDSFLKKGNHSAVVRMYFLILLRDLHEAELISWKKDKTNREYILEMSDTPHAAEFVSLTAIYEWVYFGELPITNGDFNMVQARFRQLIGKIEAKEVAS
jgi:uncharacterized membrane protein SpoIIM required for sporulation